MLRAVAYSCTRLTPNRRPNQYQAKECIWLLGIIQIGLSILEAGMTLHATSLYCTLCEGWQLCSRRRGLHVRSARERVALASATGLRCSRTVQVVRVDASARVMS